jgi:hypothetical protein
MDLVFSVLKGSPKRQKNKQINGDFNNIGSADEKK